MPRGPKGCTCSASTMRLPLSEAAPVLNALTSYVATDTFNALTVPAAGASGPAQDL